MIKAVVIFAWRGHCRRPLQTVLLAFALSITLAATMTIMAILVGIDVQMRKDLQQVGLDVVNIHVSPHVKNLFFSPLRVSDCTRIQAKFGGIMAPFRVSMGAGRDGETGRSAQVLVLSTTPDWGEVVPLEFLEGRFFRDGEQAVCVLDEWVAETLFGPNRTAVGRELHVRSLGAPARMRVVGVMRDPFQIRKKFDELDVTGSARSRLLRMMEFKSVYVPGGFGSASKRIHGAVLKVNAQDDPKQVVPQIRDQLSQDGSVWVWARSTWVGNVLQAAEFGLQIANVIWVIVLIVAGIMIMTVSLVAVRERYREIAIRRTEGARRGQIVLQLLFENVLLSVVAGCIALGLARVAGHVIEARYISWPPAFLASDLLLALGCGIVIGVLATVLPAVHASRLDPVVVLRNE